MRKNLYAKAAGILLLLSLFLLLGGCSSALMDPKGQIGAEQRTLILTAFGIMQIVVLPVIGMTLFFAWRYRRGNHNAAYTPDWAHNTWVEVVVWLIPCVIVLFLAGLTWYTSNSLDPHKSIAEEGEETFEIQAVAMDWKWLFIYPEQGIATVNEVAFPADTPVRFRVSSASVMNAFFIPDLGSQIYAMAGMDNDVHLIADEEGTYPGRSTNYSGSGFSGMTFEAHATSDEGFDEWVDEVRESSDSISFDDGYLELLKPSRNHPVEYFSEVSPTLYDDILNTYHSGEPVEVLPNETGYKFAKSDDHDEQDMSDSAEAAE